MKNKALGIYHLENLLNDEIENDTEINGKWVPVRPLGLFTLKNRLKCSWMVFSGKADVLVWPQGQ